MKTQTKFLQDLIDNLNIGKSNNDIKTLIRQRIKKVQNQTVLGIDSVSDSLQADIRNKLNPITNLIAMIEGGADTEWIKKQIPQAKISIEYLSNYSQQLNNIND